MAVNKFKIYTKTGDNGQSWMGVGGHGACKAEYVFNFIGELDEMNFLVGKVICALSTKGDTRKYGSDELALVEDMIGAMADCQHILWELGGSISSTYRNSDSDDGGDDDSDDIGGDSMLWVILKTSFAILSFPFDTIFQYADEPEYNNNADAAEERRTGDPPSTTSTMAAPQNCPQTAVLEDLIDKMDEYLPPLKHFLRMSGDMDRSEMDIHECRLAARRLERKFITLCHIPGKTFSFKGNDLVPDNVQLKWHMSYFNRMSDFFFQLARFYHLILIDRDPLYTECVFKKDPAAGNTTHIMKKKLF